MSEEFERFDVVPVGEEDTHSILKGVSFDYITNHYQNMVMHRYPSELCDLFKHVFPLGKRHADKARIDEGHGATLFYHYLIHGFRNYGVRVLDVVESESHVHPTRLVWNTYLQDVNITKVMTYADFLSESCSIPVRSLDLAIFSMYDPARSEMNSIEQVFRIIAHAIHLVKPSGFLFIEGIAPESVHYLTAAVSNLYLYPKMCRPFVFSPLGSTKTSYYNVGIQRVFEGDYNVLTPGMYPLTPVPRLLSTTSTKKTFVLVTSAMKSIGNSNIFSEDTRFRQLLHSVRTVHQHIPNAHVCMSELSELSPEQMSVLGDNGVDELQTFKGLEGVPKSFCEALVLRKVFTEVIQRRADEFDSVIKLSGRYFLTDDFKTYDPTQIICKRMRPQEVMTRFFSIPKSLFGRFVEVLDTVAERPEVQSKEMDIEHAIGQACPEMDEASMKWPRLGIAGFYATNGQMLVE